MNIDNGGAIFVNQVKVEQNVAKAILRMSGKGVISAF